MNSRQLALVFLLAGVSAGDDIIFSSGVVQKDVKVVEQTSDKIVFIDKSLKRITFPADIVQSVARKRCVIHDYEDKLAAAKDADARRARILSPSESCAAWTATAVRRAAGRALTPDLRATQLAPNATADIVGIERGGAHARSGVG